MLPGYPEKIKMHEIFHSNIYLLQHTAQQMRNSLILHFLQHSAMLKVPECQRKIT
jgi:hypothetical protein